MTLERAPLRRADLPQRPQLGSRALSECNEDDHQTAASVGVRGSFGGSGAVFCRDRVELQRAPLEPRPLVPRPRLLRAEHQAAERKVGAHEPPPAPPAKASVQQRARIGLRRKPKAVVRCWQELRDTGMQEAARAWATLLARVGGRTRALLKRLGPKIAPQHLAMIMRRWSHRTVTLHAKHAVQFLQWWELEHGPWDSERKEEVPVDDIIRYIHYLVDNGCHATVPTARVASLGFLNRLAGLVPPLPLTDISVTTLTASHRREGRRQERATVVYTVDEVRQIEQELARRDSHRLAPMHRVVLCTELRKLFAALRNDDACWDRPDTWRFEGGPDGFWYGQSYKTKATEQTATRVRGGMPWAAPMRGISDPRVDWCASALADLRTCGVEADAQYALPSPANVQLGVRPPGAAAGHEWQTALTGALAALNLQPHRTRRITLHSAKRTVLTWAGCAGGFSDRELEILGHHRSAGVGRTVRAYNVQELSASVAKWRRLLDEIASGRFNPDKPPGLQWDDEAYARWQSSSTSDLRKRPREVEPPTKRARGRKSARGVEDAPTIIDVSSSADSSDVEVEDVRVAAGVGRRWSRASPVQPDTPQKPLASPDSEREAPVQPLAPSVPTPSQTPAPGVIVASVPYPNARALYYHACVHASSKVSSAARIRPLTLATGPTGQVTTLCDFYIKSARWEADAPAGYVTCKVCAARAGTSSSSAVSASNP